MSKAEIAVKLFENYNCAQSVLSAYAADFNLDRAKALQVAAGFGAGMGRLQETCGAVTGAIMVLGLSSGFREEDNREKSNAVYAKLRKLVDDFTREKGTIKCRELLGCDLSTEEGQAFFKEHNLRSNCREYISICCRLLDSYLASRSEP